jgi:glyoxylase-like metal-dependent hydrolase (beta-lactamase superfamily II)
MCLLVKTGNHTILIDTGCGTGTQPNTGKLIPNLQAERIKLQEIDRIIITHGHPDHIGGNIDLKGKSVFTGARYFVFRKEWEFWTSGTDLIQVEDSIKKSMIASAQKKLLPLQDQIELVDTDNEVQPGIKFILASGHTPGQGILLISSGTDKLLCVSDLFHHPLLLAKPDLYVPYDISPEDAIKTRNHLLSQFVTPGLLVFGCHLPFPGLGYIEPRGDGWVWKPIS